MKTINEMLILLVIWAIFLVIYALIDIALKQSIRWKSNLIVATIGIIIIGLLS